MGYNSVALALSPTGYWRLGEPSGTVADDLVGANDGTYVNTPTLGVTGALSGSTDTAVTFDGSQSEYVSMASVPSVGTALSLVAWFKVSSGNTGRFVSLRHSGTSAAIEMGIAGGRHAAEVRNDAGGSAFIDGTFGHDDNAWHMSALVKTTSTFTFYLDGSTDGAGGTLAGAISPSVFEFARQGSAATYLTGSLDEIAIWASYALTAGDVANLWAARGDPENPPTITPPITVTRAAL